MDTNATGGRRTRPHMGGCERTQGHALAKGADFSSAPRIETRQTLSGGMNGLERRHLVLHMQLEFFNPDLFQLFISCQIGPLRETLQDGLVGTVLRVEAGEGG